MEKNLKSTVTDSLNYVNKVHQRKSTENLSSRDSYCRYCKRKGHKYDDCDRRLKRCLKCHIGGHQIKDHNDPNSKFYDGKNKKRSNQSKDVESTDLVVSQLINRIAAMIGLLILDAGCTSHFCNNIDLLCDIRNEPSLVTCANNGSVNIDKIGTFMRKNNGTNIKLINVKFNSIFPKNLISISKLTDSGASAKFTGNRAVIEYNGRIIMTAVKHNGLYYLERETQVTKDQMLVANDDMSPTELIHNRIGHIENTALKQLLTHEAIKRLAAVKEDKLKHCETCSISKVHRNAFGVHSSREKAKLPLERVHCDLSTFSDKYVSVIIDEYSRKASIKILKFKNETVDHIKNWININENKLNLKVKEFHSDGGGEYTAAELQTFLKQKGIQTTITCKGTPQHNGIAERYNRTLFNTARCLLQHAKLGMEFAEYAIKTAAHLLQFRQSVTDKTKTAYELFYGVQPSIKHLRVFGCNAFVYTNDNSKLEPRAMTGIFIGYSELHIMAMKSY